MKNITGVELYNLVRSSNIIIIDIRPDIEFNLSHIPKSSNINPALLLQNPSIYLNRSISYIICESGKKSSALCLSLSNKGFNVVNVLGGIDNYPGPLV